MIEYQYRGMPHAHMVFCLDNAHDIDADNQEDLIDFVNRNFIAELPQFEGEEFQNVHWWDDENELTDDHKAKALEMVPKHNLHNCAVAVNGCKKDISDRCRRGYSHTDTINETYVNQLTDIVVYQCQHRDDLRVVPYNLQMMMDWDSHINVEYSSSGHCVQYLYKYLFKGPARRERMEMYSGQEHDSHDEIKLLGPEGPSISP
jgi:hypothetical protein